MKKNICGVLVAIGLFLILGIVGGVENGEPLKNVLWCVPIFIVMRCALTVGNLSNYDEEE